MSKFGFIGPTYALRSITADGQRTQNLYPEVIESGTGKGDARMYLLSSPGLRKFCEFAGEGPIRGLFTDSTRTLAVTSKSLYDLKADGTYTKLGNVWPGRDPATIASNGAQYMITSNAGPVVYDPKQNVTIIEPPLPRDIFQCGEIDGYFLGLQKSTGTFYLSGLFDGLSWDPLDFAKKQGAADRTLAFLCDHREIWLFGGQTIEAWYNSGNPDFPFQRLPGAFAEMGIAAPASACRVDNTIFWLGSDYRGGGMVWKVNGYTPSRVSNHSIEYLISTYPRIDDAVGFTWQQDGHAFYQLWFPTAQATLVFDASTHMWHERTWWEPVHGIAEAHRASCHVYAFGKHLVGDRDLGIIYEQSPSFYDDDGVKIRRVRTAPHISNDMKWMFHQSLQIDMQVGIGLDGFNGLNAVTWNEETRTWQDVSETWDSIGGLSVALAGYDPQVVLQYSDDGGHTWGNEMAGSAGKIGETNWRVRWNRLGRSRDRVYRVVITDPVKVALIDAYLRVSEGYSN